MPATATGAKYCCKCGTDVTTIQRMKDSSGRYWCLPCGQKDQETKVSNTGSLCAMCGEMFANSQLTQMSGAAYCAKCLKKKYKNAGGGGLSVIKRLLPSGSDGEDAGRRTKMTVILIVLVGLIVVVNYLMH